MIFSLGQGGERKNSLYQSETPRMAEGETGKYSKCSLLLPKSSFTLFLIKALSGGGEDPSPRRLYFCTREASSVLVGLVKSAVKATEGMYKRHLRVCWGGFGAHLIPQRFAEMKRKKIYFPRKSYSLFKPVPMALHSACSITVCRHSLSM